MEEVSTEDGEKFEARNRMGVQIANLKNKIQHPEEVDDTLPPHLMKR